MEKTTTRKIEETLIQEGTSPQTARQAAVTINADRFFNQRTERGSNKVVRAWEESVMNAE